MLPAKKEIVLKVPPPLICINSKDVELVEREPYTVTLPEKSISTFNLGKPLLLATHGALIAAPSVNSKNTSPATAVVSN